MEPKEIKALVDQIQLEIKGFNEAKAAMQTLIDSKAPAEKIKELTDLYNAGKTSIETLSKQLDTIQLEMKDRALNGKPVSIFGDFKKAFDAKKAELKSPGGQFAFDLKDIDPRMLLKASTIDEATELSNSSTTTAVVVPMRTPGVEKAPDRPVLMMDVVNRGTTNSNRVTWVERSARTAGAAALAEGAQYLQSDMTYIMKVAEVEKIGTFIKVTNEALEDWDELLTQIKNELLPMVERALETELYSGSGTTPHLDGIITTASAYATNSLDASIITPNIFDVILAAATQIAEYNYVPTHAFLAPADFAKMIGSKSADGTYVLPPFITAGGMSVAGVKVIQSTLITAGSILVGDFSRVTLYLKRGIEIKIWDQDSTDPEYDLKTITASCRAAVKFPAPHIYAFVYDAIADITTEIQAV